MSDLRQGVSPAMHAVLDEVEAIMREAPLSPWFHVSRAELLLARLDQSEGSWGDRADRARAAAARLLAFAEAADARVAEAGQ